MRFRRRKYRRTNDWKGLLAGMAGGLAASWTMNQFQSVWSRASEALCCQKEGPGAERQAQEGESEDATMKTAGRLARVVLQRELSHEEKKRLGPVVHYAFGTLMGACYGVAAEHRREVTKGYGTAFGTVLFAGADEIAVPALGLSGGPGEAPLSTHAYALVSHWVYGATAEAVRRGLRG
jgi:hypothetical protein